jgi:hypothetical protein
MKLSVVLVASAMSWVSYAAPASVSDVGTILSCVVFGKDGTNDTELLCPPTQITTVSKRSVAPETGDQVTCVVFGQNGSDTQLLCPAAKSAVAARDDNTHLAKRCFQNRNGWYWCAFDDVDNPVHDDEKRDLSNAFTKRCFDNGNGWLWCGWDAENPETNSTAQA